MAVALCTLSHAPLYGLSDPDPETTSEVHAAFDEMRSFIREFDPELTIIFGPDHYNGVFYDMMPPYCIGSRATSVGDWGTEPGPLPVDRPLARALVKAVLDSGIDIAQSEEMHVDHGISQPLELLFGKNYTNPIIPIFINAVGLPLGPMQRIRLLGEAVGRQAALLGKRVLVIGSGGLSHDPPVPRLEESAPEVVARLIDGRNPSAELKAAREARIFAAAAAHAAGNKTARDINPEFDALVLSTLAGGRLEDVDDWSNEWFEEAGGHSAHEIRTWVAAYSAMRAAGEYEVIASHYWPVEEWMTGFGMTIARTIG
ncbi:3-carboxyethylcatechol 2,3-dioxygenase [soil metagenome]